MGSITIENYSENFLVDMNLRQIHKCLKAIEKYNMFRHIPVSEISIQDEDSIIFDAIRANLIDIQSAASKTIKLEDLPEWVIEDYYLKQLSSLDSLTVILYGAPLTRKVVNTFMSTLFDKVFKVYDEVFAEN